MMAHAARGHEATMAEGTEDVVPLVDAGVEMLRGWLAIGCDGDIRRGETDHPQRVLVCEYPVTVVTVVLEMTKLQHVKICSFFGEKLL